MLLVQEPEAFAQDPDAYLDYSIDWSNWLPEGDTISTSSWTADAGITTASAGHSTTATTVWVSGGTLGANYRVKNTIVTAAGRINVRSVLIMVTRQ